MSETRPARMPLHTKILLALILGAFVGTTINLLTSRPGFRPEHLLVLDVQPGFGFPGAAPLAGVLEVVRAKDTWVDWVIRYVMRPIGDVFLNLLFLTVIPLVFSSLALGVAQLERS